MILIRTLFFGIRRKETDMTIEETQKLYEPMLRTLPNFIGIALGQKLQGGKRVGRIAIVVFVQVKVPESALSPDDIIPKMIDMYETDVVETGGVWAFCS